MSVEILPCPNPGCGGAVESYETLGGRWLCSCLECSYTTSQFDTEAAAIAAHNAIAAAVHDHAAVVAERDALRAQAGRLREIVAGWQKLHSRFAFRGGAWPMVEEEAKHLLSCSGAALAATAPAGEEANRG